MEEGHKQCGCYRGQGMAREEGLGMMSRSEGQGENEEIR